MRARRGGLVRPGTATKIISGTRHDRRGPGVRARRWACPDVPRDVTPLAPAHRSGSWRDIDPGCEHDFPPVRVLVGDAAVGLPVADLGNRAGTRGGEPGLDLLPGGSIRQV